MLPNCIQSVRFGVLLCFFLIISLLYSVVFAQNSEKVADNWKSNNQAILIAKDGIKAARAGNYEKAIVLLLDALEKEVHSVEVLIQLAFSHEKIGYDESAINYYLEAIKLIKRDFPGSKEELLLAQSNISTLYLKQEDLINAQLHLSQCVKLKPKNLYYLCQYGYVLAELGRIDEAIIQYEMAHSIKPKNEKIFSNLTELYKTREKITSSKKELEFNKTAVLHTEGKSDVKPDESELKSAKEYLLLGKSYENKGKFENALLAYQKAIQYDKQQKKTYLNLALLYFKMKQTSKSIEVLKDAVKLFPKWTTPHKHLGRIYFQMNKYDLANQCFQNIINLNKGFSPAYFYSAICYEYKEGKRYAVGFNKQKAINNYLKAIELNPQYLEAFFNLGHLYAATEDWKLSKYYFKQALKQKKDSFRVYFYLGFVSAKLNQYLYAIDKYEMAVALNPNYLDAFYNLGVIYQEVEKYEEAIQCYLRVIELQPNSLDALLNLALIYDRDLKNKYYANKYYHEFVHYSKAGKEREFANKRIQELNF